MKKSKQKVVEARIQAAVNAYENYDEERMNLVKQRAFAEYTRRMQPGETTRPEKSRSKIKSLCRGAMAVCVLALALVVIPVVYTALMPVTVGNAHDFVYTAGLWLNDTLHLGLEFEKPMLDNEALEAVKEAKSVQYDTVEEAAAVLGYPIYALDEEAYGDNLKEILITYVADNVFRVSLQYCFIDGNVLITQEPMLESNVIAPLEDTDILQSKAGELIVWNSGDKCRALHISGGWFLNITGDLSLSDIYDVLTTLHAVN